MSNSYGVKVKVKLMHHNFCTCQWNLSCTTTTATVLGPFVRDYPGEPVPEEKNTHPPSWSSSNLYQFLPSTTIHSILPIQITCLTIVLHNLSPCSLWSTSWSGALHFIFHTFLHPVSSFCNTCPNHCNLFCCSINIISSIPSLSTPYLELFLNITHPFNHSHLWSPKCHLIFFPRQARSHFRVAYYFAHRCYTACHNKFLLVSDGTICLNLFHPIRILASTAASASPSTLNISPR